jgi:hypothetical protein
MIALFEKVPLHVGDIERVHDSAALSHISPDPTMALSPAKSPTTGTTRFCRSSSRTILKFSPKRDSSEVLRRGLPPPLARRRSGSFVTEAFNENGPALRKAVIACVTLVRSASVKGNP